MRGCDTLVVRHRSGRCIRLPSRAGPAAATVQEEEIQMPQARLKVARLAVPLFALTLLLPAAAPVAAADPLILRAGTTQTVQSLNPWNVVEVVDYEIMTLNYDTLVGFGPDVNPAPGFAESWTRSDDGHTWTFKIREGMKWSDGQPATSEDARWTMQYVLDATTAGRTLGLGYLEPYQTAAGVTEITAPDPTTLVVKTSLDNPLLLESYVPILPAHIWSKLDPKTASTNFQNPPPIVGTGPYQVVEYKPGQYVRLTRNPYYWGNQGAADQIVITTFKNDDTMIQALKKGELDYARDVPAAQFDQLKANPGGPIVTTEGVSNTFYQLTMNTYTKPIPGGGASTKALQDPAFRDAIGYAIDKQAIVDKVFAGHATVGSTQITPFQAGWHAEPSQLRTFDIAKANAKLDAAGYPRDASGRRLDKEGKQITLRLTWPGSNEEAKSAQLISDWFGQVGIKVDAKPSDEGKLTSEILPPEAGGKANFDMFIWDWVGDPDPTSLLKLLTTKEIGASSDSLWSNAEYDALYEKQLAETDDAARHAEVAQMQQLFYDNAPYHVLYYPSQLDANRTDRFGNWHTQPTKNGNPLFGFGSLDYTLLTDANAPVATPSPAPAAAATPAGSASTAPAAPSPVASPSATPAPAPSSTGSDSTPLLLGGVVVLVVIVAIGLLVLRRSRSVGEEE
jgi:peptide/nickel transport system substrate-binding protein